MKRWNGAGTWDILANPNFPFDCYVHKTVTVNEIKGDPDNWRPWGTGIVNNVGLVNPGLDKFKAEVLSELQKLDIPFAVSIWAEGLDWIKLAEQISDTNLELNLSCPNYGRMPSRTMIAHAVNTVRNSTTKNVAVKLSPHASLDEIRECEAAGADRLVLSNSLNTPIGALSGAPIKSLSLELVESAAKVVDIPITGCGGISNVLDELDYISAGATDIARGSDNLLRPRRSLKTK